MRIRIEAYDISNIAGDYAVGSMVVFTNSKAYKNEYRKFKIKTVAGINDVAMMREVLRRRFQNDWPKPDLILLDGGKGHLGMAEGLLEELRLDIPVAAVAKGPDRRIFNFQIFRQRRIRLGRTIFKNIQSLKIQKLKHIFDNKALLANITSEAHRFAISYHKKLRKKSWKSR